MQAYGYVFMALVLSTGVVAVGQAAQGQPSKHGGPRSLAGSVQEQRPAGDGKGSSSINGTRVGVRHSSSIKGTGMGVQHDASINGTRVGAWH